MSTTTVKKSTKKEKYSALSKILYAAQDNGIVLEDEEITYDSLQEFIADEIDLLDKKTAAAKARAAEKKERGDELRDRIYEVLNTEEYMTMDEILRALGDDTLTSYMVTPRLTQLIDPEVGKVEKEVRTIPSKVEGGKPHKATVYKRVG